MKRNVALNELDNRVTVAELNWSATVSLSIAQQGSCLHNRGEPIPDNIPTPDLILAADCVYFEPAFPLLVQTLADLVTDLSTDVLFCYKKRRKVNSLLTCRPR